MAEIKHADESTVADENTNKDDKQFTCGICNKNCKTLRYLSTCGHTFCENCLLAYARHIQQEAHANTLECPVCKTPNNVPEHDEVTLDWIQTFPLNTQNDQMIKSLSMSSEEEQILCDSCREEGERKAGLHFCLDCNEALCGTCMRFHKKVKAYKDHKLVDVRDMPSQKSRTNILAGITKCASHPDRNVEIYCKTHAAVVCVMCLIFDHKSCDVTEIAMHNFDVTKLQTDIETLVAQMKAAIEHLNLACKLKVDTKSNVIQKLKGFRENVEQVRDKVVELMDTVVNQVAEVTKGIEKESEDEADTEVDKMTKMKEQTEHNIAFLKTVEEHGSKEHTFVATTMMMKQFEETSRQILEVDEHRKQIEVELKLADDLKKLIEIADVDNLAQINVTEISSSHRQLEFISNILRDKALVKAEEHTVRHDSGRKPSYYGVAVRRDGTVILSDYNNGRMDLFNPITKTLYTVELVNYQCCSIGIDERRIAAIGLNGKNIVIGTELKQEKTLSTDQKKTRSIVSLTNGQLAIAWNSPPAFGVVDISGTKVLEQSYLDQDTSGRKFKSFDYLAVDEGRKHVIQPCTKDKAVYCFEFTGKPVFEYTNPKLTYPQGVAIDKCGNIYVCEYTSTGSIHRMTPTGEPISVITDDVPPYPLAICGDVTGTGFWVTRYSSPYDQIAHFKLDQNTEC